MSEKRRVRVDLPIEVDEESDAVVDVLDTVAEVRVEMINGRPHVRSITFGHPRAEGTIDLDQIAWETLRRRIRSDLMESEADGSVDELLRFLGDLDKLTEKGKRRYNRLSPDDLDKIAAVDLEYGGGAAAAKAVAGMYFVSDRTAERYLKQAREAVTS